MRHCLACLTVGAEAARSWEEQGASQAASEEDSGSDSASRAEAATLAARLRALHETTCRLVHWAARAAANEEAAVVQAALLQLADWRLLLRAVHGVFSAACEAQRSAEAPEGDRMFGWRAR